MCRCREVQQLASAEPVTLQRARADLLNQRGELLERLKSGDLSTASSIEFIDNVLSGFPCQCQEK